MLFSFLKGTVRGAARAPLADIVVGIHRYRNFIALLEARPILVIFDAIIVSNGMAISDNKQRFLEHGVLASPPKYPTENIDGKHPLSLYNRK